MPLISSLGVMNAINFGLASSLSVKTYDVFAAINSTPYINAYKFSSNTGFGTKYANPASLPPNQSYDIAISNDNSLVGIVGLGSPYVQVYNWASGFGTKYADPSPAIPIYGFGVAFNKSKTAISIGSNELCTYSWSNGFGTKYTSPATLPGGYVRSVDFSSDDTTIVLGHQSSPYILAYPWSDAGGYGTKYADPSSLVADSIQSVKFNPSKTYIAAASSAATNNILVYSWASGFGTKTTIAASFTGANRTYFSKSGSIVAFAGTGSVIGVNPVVTCSFSSSGVGSSYEPSATLSKNGVSVGICPDDKAILWGVNAGVYLYAYRYTPNVGYGSLYSNPSTSIANYPNTITFSN